MPGARAESPGERRYRGPGGPEVLLPAGDVTAGVGDLIARRTAWLAGNEDVLRAALLEAERESRSARVIAPWHTPGHPTGE